MFNSAYSQHYHASLILLHRTFAQFKQWSLLEESEDDESEERRHSDQICQLSRTICFNHAISLAQMFRHHHAVINGRRMLLPAVGHADVAATTLLMSLKYTKDLKKRQKALPHLHDLSEILRALGASYVPAEKMSKALDQTLKNERNLSLATDVAATLSSARRASEGGMNGASDRPSSTKTKLGSIYAGGAADMPSSNVGYGLDANLPSTTACRENLPDSMDGLNQAGAHSVAAGPSSSSFLPYGIDASLTL